MFSEFPGMSASNSVRRVMNVQILSRLSQSPKVKIINNDSVLEWHKDEVKRDRLISKDGVSLTAFGIGELCSNWLNCMKPDVKVHSKEVLTSPVSKVKPVETQSLNDGATKSELTDDMKDTNETLKGNTECSGIKTENSSEIESQDTNNEISDSPNAEFQSNEPKSEMENEPESRKNEQPEANIEELKAINSESTETDQKESVNNESQAIEVGDTSETDSKQPEIETTSENDSKLPEIETLTSETEALKLDSSENKESETVTNYSTV